MADLTAVSLVDARPESGVWSWKIRNGVTLYENMLVGIDASTGYLEPWADGSGDLFVGLLTGGDISDINTGVILGDTSETPPPRGHVDTSGAILTKIAVGGSPAIANIGDLVYSPDSDPASITLTASGNVNPIGMVYDFDSASDVIVKLFTPMEAKIYQATV